MKFGLRIKAGEYTLAKTIELPVQLEELEKIIEDAKKLGEIHRTTKKKKSKNIVLSGKKKYQRANIWTPKEIQQIKELYPTHSTTKMSRIIGRTSQAISTKLKEIGVKKHRRQAKNIILSGKNSYKRKDMWTQTEINLLKSNFRDMTASELSRLVGRSLYATRKKLYQLRLGPRKMGRPKQENRKATTKTWTKKEEKFLLNNAGKKSWEEIGRYCRVSSKSAYDKWYYLSNR